MGGSIKLELRVDMAVQDSGVYGNSDEGTELASEGLEACGSSKVGSVRGELDNYSRDGDRYSHRDADESLESVLLREIRLRC